MLDVLETTKSQMQLHNKIKIYFVKHLQKPLYRLRKFQPFFTFESFVMYYIFLLLLFGRSFTGIDLFGFRVGELMTGTAIVIFVYFLTKKSLIESLLGKNGNLVLKLILLQFFISTVFSGSIKDLLDLQVYRSSSYMWSLGFLFVLYVLRKPRIFDSNLFLTGMIFVLPLTFLLTSVYYPNIISEFFTIHSDKFRLLKGSDLFMAYAIYCLLYFERIKNNNFIYIFTFILSGALIPLIVFSSRGASIGTLIVLVYFIYKNRRALVRSKILFLGSSLIFLTVLTLSSIYLDWTKIDFEEINTEVALESLEMTLVSKRYPETVKPTFYIENNRLNSGDGNLNWRLQIWQDVSSDLYKTNKLISGYGFKGAIPAMQEEGRTGLDGTNIHVHNYFVNILARGGVIHLLLFIIFYAILITKFMNKENGKGVAAFIVGVLFVSFFDSSMESVRFPFLFYIILSYKLKKE